MEWSCFGPGAGYGAILITCCWARSIFPFIPNTVNCKKKISARILDMVMVENIWIWTGQQIICEIAGELTRDYSLCIPGQGVPVTVQSRVFEESPSQSLPSWNGPVLVLVLVRVPSPSHVAEQGPFVQSFQTQSTERKQKSCLYKLLCKHIGYGHGENYLKFYKGKKIWP